MLKHKNDQYYLISEFLNVMQLRNVVLQLRGIRDTRLTLLAFCCWHQGLLLSGISESLPELSVKNCTLNVYSTSLYLKEHGSVCRDVWWWIHRGWMFSSFPRRHHTQCSQHGADIQPYPVNSKNNNIALQIYTHLCFSFILATCKSLWCSKSPPASGEETSAEADWEMLVGGRYGETPSLACNTALKVSHC